MLCMYIDMPVLVLLVSLRYAYHREGEKKKGSSQTDQLIWWRKKGKEEKVDMQKTVISREE